jgi:methylenetetrahydrofolate dehydrogenase (NADP+)/methenyltetrahydrofolate cyclohydrolase
MAKILDGVSTSTPIRAEVADGIAGILKKYGVAPTLATVLVGDNPASAIYVRNKYHACQNVGLGNEVFHLPADTTEIALLGLVKRLNQDSRLHGILVQLPLPAHIDEQKIILALDPDKDVDGLHPMNVGKLATGVARYVPCTPAGVQQILVRNGYDIAGTNVVVCGRSQIVGLPLALLLMQKQNAANATVTICHSGTRDLIQHTSKADILVSAMGRPGVITGNMVKEGVIVIDVGINYVKDSTSKRGYRILGDVDFDSVSAKAEAISPVPGGVGPMTITMLLMNTMLATRYFVHGAP